MSVQTSRKQPRRSAPKGRGALVRLLSGLWMALYLGIAVGAPVADGLVDHHDEIVLHIEDANSGDCPASHGTEPCDICQLAHGLRAVPAPLVVELPRGADIARVATGARDVAPVELIFLDGRSSRAPPLG